MKPNTIKNTVRTVWTFAEKWYVDFKAEVDRVENSKGQCTYNLTIWLE